MKTLSFAPLGGLLAVLACSSSAPVAGDVDGGPGSDASGPCVPKTCADVGACGATTDGCGGMLDCTCGAGQRCVAGKCACDATSCGSGCCTADGKCSPGTTTDACGTGGAACNACAPGSNATTSCTAGKCAAACDAGYYACRDKCCAVLPAVAISAGASFTCAITSAGGVRCWGDNTYGQLGDGTTLASTVPVDVSGLSGVTAIAAAGGGWSTTQDAHACALTSAGAVYCWGSNKFGQLANGSSAGSSVPVAATGLSSGVTAIAVGVDSTCVLKSGGVLCAGMATGVSFPSKTAVAKTGLTQDVVAITAGDLHWCAEMNLGGILCWGYNASGQLGDGTTSSAWGSPTGVTGGYSFMGVSAGSQHTCGLMSTNGALCWGSGGSGQLGDGTWDDSSVPMGVSGLVSGVKQLAAGGDDTCALMTTGGVQCWGYNWYGQLGDGTNIQRWTPVSVSGVSGITSIAVGGDGSYTHACGIGAGGKVVCWGSDGFGELGDGAAVSKGACSHDLCRMGDGLTASCDGSQGCVAKVCAADAYCCTSGGGEWSTICVSEVAKYCSPLRCGTGAAVTTVGF